MAEVLPKLREDIELTSTQKGEFTLFDRASAKYYRLDELSFVILSQIHKAATKAELFASVTTITPCTMEDVEEVLEFCKKHFLIRSDPRKVAELIALNKKRNSTPWYTKLIHGYLFFKIHLFNPDSFLDHTLDTIRFLYADWFRWMMIAFFSINTVFILNRFAEFSATLTNFVTLEGLFYLLISVVIVKTFHEFGHAYATKRYGCTVPSMGIAFMLFYPMPYTDTTDSWRLPPKQRMSIALAGVKTEMAIAAFAMSGWLWLPDGMLKGVMFFIVAVALIGTLIINLTPFMRFDGYYTLSDYMGIENLHHRAFSQAKAFVKRHLWGIEVPVEHFPRKTRSFLILFAFSTWIYRLILFTGIAYLVYSYTFKVLGIILFLIEIWYFILLPVVREIKEWYSLRSKASLRRSNVAGWLIVSGSLSLLFIPYSTTLRFPAVLESNASTSLYSEYDAQIIYAHPEGAIKKGDILLSTQSVKNDVERQSALRKLALFQKQASNAFLFENTLHDTGKYLQSAKTESLKVNAADSLKENMNIIAPHEGIVMYEHPLKQGEFVGVGQKVAIVLDPAGASVTAYVEDVKLSEIVSGVKGEFFDFLTIEKHPMRVGDIELAPVDVLTDPLLSSNFQGSITVNKDNVPQRPHYKIKLTQEHFDGSNVYYKHHGEIKIEVKYESFIKRITNKVVSVALQESEF